MTLRFICLLMHLIVIQLIELKIGRLVGAGPELWDFLSDPIKGQSSFGSRSAKKCPKATIFGGKNP